MESRTFAALVMELRRFANPFMELLSSPTIQTIRSVQATSTGNGSASGNGNEGATDNGNAHGNAR